MSVGEGRGHGEAKGEEQSLSLLFSHSLWIEKHSKEKRKIPLEWKRTMKDRWTFSIVRSSLSLSSPFQMADNDAENIFQSSSSRPFTVRGGCKFFDWSICNWTQSLSLCLIVSVPFVFLPSAFTEGFTFVDHPGDASSTDEQETTEPEQKKPDEAAPNKEEEQEEEEDNDERGVCTRINEEEKKKILSEVVTSRKSSF